MPRDFELLRTIKRLHYVTSRELFTTFFRSADAGRKRLTTLHGRMLIEPHSKGVPPGTNYSAWRITQRGLALIVKQWPWEVARDGLVDFLSRWSLYNLDHREAIAQVYLDFVRGSEPVPENDSELRPWILRRTERANAVLWEPDGDVVLHCERLGKRIDLIPDAVVTSRHKRVRIFLELDRSNKALPRIRENLERYSWHLGQQYALNFADRRVPHVVYVVGSEARQSRIAALCKELLGSRFAWQVLLLGKTTEWLEGVLVSAQIDQQPIEPKLNVAAKRAIHWTNHLLKKLQDRGWLATLDREDPAFFDDGRRTVLVLHEELGTGKAS